MFRDLINRRTIVSDSIAGLTLGIESIPDAKASGLLAAVNPIHAVYAVMLATPVGALFASSVFMLVEAYHVAEKWVAEHIEPESEEARGEENGVDQ